MNATLTKEQLAELQRDFEAMQAHVAKVQPETVRVQDLKIVFDTFLKIENCFPQLIAAAEQLEALKTDPSCLRANLLRGTLAILPDLCFAEDEHGPVSQVRAENERLRKALQMLYDETADYIRVNHLGDVHHNQSMKQAYAALK